jgi:Flp pilus assembly protein TadG
LQDRAAMNLLLARCRELFQAFACASRGNVAVIFAFAIIPLIAMVGAALDYSRGNSVKADMQAALDATALMLASGSSASSMTPAQLNASATSKFMQIFNRPYAHNIAIAASQTTQPPTITVSGSAAIDTTLLAVIGIKTLNITATTTVNYGSSKVFSLNIVLDSSASMIVGATQTDVNTITNWVSANWTRVKPGDPPPLYPDGHVPPCAFACHDLGSQTTPADVAMGLQNAHAAGATTRFDVMISATQQLISALRTQSQQPQNSNNSYLFNVMSFDTSLHQWGASNMNFSAATTAIQSVTLGLDTYLSTALSSLITQVGQQGNGSSASSPLKFVILVSDGLQSDRTGNQNCSYRGYDPVWNWSDTCFNNGVYPNTIQASQCNQIKAAGITFAILETPYVPLTGQDPSPRPGYGFPYEATVRHFIYPNGPNTASTVSQALAACASPGYYFQATQSAQIATGILSLTNKFLSNSTPFISK